MYEIRSEYVHLPCSSLCAVTELFWLFLAFRVLVVPLLDHHDQPTSHERSSPIVKASERPSNSKEPIGTGNKLLLHGFRVFLGYIYDQSESFPRLVSLFSLLSGSKLTSQLTLAMVQVAGVCFDRLRNIEAKDSLE